MLITRSDRSKKAIWFWTIDRWLFSSYLILISLGAFFIMASGPKMADNLNLENHFFTMRHIIFLVVGFLLVLFFSQLNERSLKIISIIGTIVCILLMFLTVINGIYAKGAQRWINIFGQSLQPSEFIKPLFVVVNAWLLYLWKNKINFRGWLWSISSVSLIVFLLLLQPDLGMSLLIISVWLLQLFLSGASLKIIVLLVCSLPTLLIVSYFYFDHVYHRINIFIQGTSWQSVQAIKSFQNGGFFGRGMGEGFYKNNLPDAHTDFVFAIWAEESGAIGALLVMLIYAGLVARIIWIGCQ